MLLSFHPCFAADVQIILGDRQLSREDLSLIAEAEAILLPQGCPIALYRACKASPGFVFPNYEMRFQYPGKTGQSLLFEKMRWPHPMTRRWDSVSSFKDPLRDEGRLPHPMPFFLKRNNSHEGAGVYPVQETAQIE